MSGVCCMVMYRLCPADKPLGVMQLAVQTHICMQLASCSAHRTLLRMEAHPQMASS